MKNIRFDELAFQMSSAGDNVPYAYRNYLVKISDVFYSFTAYFTSIYTGRRSQKNHILHVLNCLTSAILDDEYYVGEMTDEFVESFNKDISEEDLKEKLGYLYIEDVIWNIDPIDVPNIAQNHSEISADASIENTSKTAHADTSTTTVDSSKKESKPIEFVQYRSKRSDLSFEFPTIPSIDTSKVWAVSNDDAGRSIEIYTTLPEIPTIQNEITTTTDVRKMTSAELIHLYPDHTIQVRSKEAYDKFYGIDYDDLLGYIPQIFGFTREQIVDNIIKYPQFNFLYREIGDRRVSFLKHIEIDGELIRLESAIDTVDDLKLLPDKNFYYWDYIVRRYLLERDILGVIHKYPMYGSFGPYMTLFTTPDVYMKLGYDDIEGMARQCVMNRVKFYQTRNPLVRRLLFE